MALALAVSGAAPALAQSQDFEAAFDRTLGTERRAPQTFDAVYQTSLERRIAQLAEGSRGRIGVAAIDLSTGERIGVLDNQMFPMASTSKVAVAATFLELVEQGKYTLTSEFPLLIPVGSARFSSAAAPVREGEYMPAHQL
ncbi:MAG: serine hydrolase, partial [Erythrobacter sp.]